MPIQLPESLPATATLRSEGITVRGEKEGTPGTGPKLNMVLLNLMPDKVTTETQFARLLGATPYEVDLTLLRPASHQPRHTPARHLDDHYRTWDEVRSESFDGLIVTGAPVETLPFEEVDYWDELDDVFDWAGERVRRSFFVCWAAQAALYHRYDVPKHPLEEKMFGVFGHGAPRCCMPALRGLGGEVPIPVSRHTEVRRADLPGDGRIEVLLDSPESGLGLLGEDDGSSLYMFNHLEYDSDTLGREYWRDRHCGRPVPLPRHYFRGDDPRGEPLDSWRAHANLFFRNWLDDIQDARRHAADGQAALDWLFAGGREAAAPQTRAADFLILGRDGRDDLPEVISRLATFGLSPEAVRVQRRRGAASWIELRLGEVRGQMAERISQDLLRNGLAQGVSYRSPVGRGGHFVSAPAYG